MYHAIVFLPLVGFLIAGLFGRRPRARARARSSPPALLFVSAVLSWVAFFQVGFGDRRDARARSRNGCRSGDLVGRLGVPDRHADRGDAGRRQHRLGARAPLFDRLHARRPAPAALLRLSVALHLRHADAGDGRQPRADVLRLGRRRPRVLSADRLLVPEGHRPTRRRSRPSSSTASAISASRSASSRVFVLFDSVAFDQIFPRVAELAERTIHASSASTGTR